MSGKRGGRGGKQGGDAPKKEEFKPEGNFKFDFGGEAPKEIPSVFDFAGKDAGLIEMMQKKLGNIIGASSGYLETLPPAIQNRVKALKKLHEEKMELESQFRAELAALEKKYEALYDPLFVKRTEIVSGAVEPSAEDRGDRVWEVNEAGEKKETEAPATEKGIPEFWLTALKHHDELGEMITERDEAALKLLTDVKSRLIGEGPSFALDFHFAPNEFFTNDVISKTYHLVENKAAGDIMYDHTESTTINWKEGKNLTVHKVTKEQKPKGGKGRGGRRGRGGASAPGRTITVEEPCNSFFNFFSPEPVIPMLDDEEEPDEDTIEAVLEADYELGVEFREHIIPNAVLFFTGEALEGDDYDYDDDGDDDDEEGDFDSEDDEEFEAPPQGQPGQQAECKQQ